MPLKRYNRINGPGFDDLFAPTPFFPDRHLDRSAEDEVLQKASPGFEIHEHDGQYQISVDVPGVKASDMSLELEQDGTVLRLSGARKVTEGDCVTETRFDKMFAIGGNIDTEKMTANLADRVLILKVPKREIEKPRTLTIPITEHPHEKEKEEKE
jgi:HSP20 family protein